ncbi:MAG: response regulator [Lachnospiraceae bacterium]|nr:response regulator [Lachnospiraceae bacterium]
MNHRLLFIEGTKGFVNNGIVLQLENAGFEIIRTGDVLEDIAQKQYDTNIYIYYPSGGKERIVPVTHYLVDLSRDNGKSICLIGDQPSISETKIAAGDFKFAGVFPRPVDIRALVLHIQNLANIHFEYERRHTILVIDDDNDYLTILRNWLKTDYKVSCVRSGIEALLFLDHVQPDLILLDYEMPDLDGYQTIKYIRKNPVTTNIPVIFLTGKNERENVMKVFEQRPDGYLLKTLKKDELLEILHHFFLRELTEGL